MQQCSHIESSVVRCVCDAFFSLCLCRHSAAANPMPACHVCRHACHVCRQQSTRFLNIAIAQERCRKKNVLLPGPETYLNMGLRSKMSTAKQLYLLTIRTLLLHGGKSLVFWHIFMRLAVSQVARWQQAAVFSACCSALKR
jgi:hypothetical protein